MKQKILHILFLALTLAALVSAMAVSAFAEGEACGHIPGDAATCTDAQICTVCNEELTAALGHTEAFENTEAGKHRIYCSVCEATITASENCYGGHATCEYQAKCDACDTAYGATPAGHIYGTEWVGSEIYHFHACDNCGSPKTADREEHSFRAWSAVATATSETEGRDERSCSICGFTQNRAMPKLTPERMSTFAIVAIIAGSVLVVAVGVFAIVWFAVKKKTFGDIAALFKKKSSEQPEEQGE